MKFLVALAVIPGLLIMRYVHKKDKIEKEPTSLLIKLFFFGVLSSIPAVIYEWVGEYLIYGEFLPQNADMKQLFIYYFLVVGLGEELFKFLFLKLGSWKNKAFDYRFDALVYAICVGMGFALFENILYVLPSGVGTGITRALISIPGHATFAVTMGCHYGQAKLCDYKGDAAGRRRNLLRAVISPTLMHGFFDFALSADSVLLIIVFFVYIIIADIAAVVKIRSYSNTDTRIAPESESIIDMLASEAVIPDKKED